MNTLVTGLEVGHLCAVDWMSKSTELTGFPGLPVRSTLQNHCTITGSVATVPGRASLMADGIDFANKRFRTKVAYRRLSNWIFASCQPHRVV